MKIKIPKEIIHDCEKFAINVVGTNIDKYRLRKQSDTEFIKKQISQGKIAEFGVWLILDKMCTKPDLEIYNSANKSFNADLVLEDKLIHVKSQGKQSAMRYGQSWVFQAEDPLFKYATNDDVCAFCVVEGDEVELVLFKRFNKLVFGEPKLKKLINIKKMVYFSDNI